MSMPDRRSRPSRGSRAACGRCRTRDPRRDRRPPAPGTPGACRCGSSIRAAAATRARDARRRAAPRPGTSSAPRTRRAGADRGSRARTPWYVRPHPRHVSASRGPGERAWQSGQRTSASRVCGDHRLAADRHVGEEPFEPLGASIPRERATRACAPRRARRDGERRIAEHTPDAVGQRRRDPRA